MGTYAVTGGASGIGLAICQALKKRGDDVISIDIRDADIVADLSTPEGCSSAVKELTDKASGGLDGFVPCAGVGSNLPGETVVAINYVAVVKTVEGAMPLLQKNKGSVVLISSTSAPMKEKNEELCALLVAGDYDQAIERSKTMRGNANYAGTKNALVQWMRANCAEWVKKGVRVNAVAPGMTMTALVEAQFKDPEYSELMKQYRDMIPMGTAQPSDIANVIIFLLGKESRYCCGSLLFIDGGIDALTRPDVFSR